MTDAELLKKEEIDSDKNDKIDVQEMENFLDSEDNIKKLGESMDSNISPELLQELESSLKNLCENILNLDKITGNQQKILDYFKDKFGDKYPEIKEKIQNKISSNETNEQIDEDISAIQQEIDIEANKILQNMPLSNLQELGIDISSQSNKKLIGIKRGNLIKDIKKPEDITKINDENINQYFTIPNNIPRENYASITENIKQILYRHLQLHPGRRTIIGNGGYSSGMSLKSTRENDTYEANLHKQIQKLQQKSLNEQIKIIVKGIPNNSNLLDLWLKTTLNQKDEKGKNKYKQDDVLKIFFDKIPVEQSNKFFQACEKNKFINELKNNYAIYWLNKNNSIKTGDGKYCFLDWKNKSKFNNLLGKGIKLSEKLSFDQLYNHTKDFYKNIEKFGFDSSIPLNEIIKFLNSQSQCYQKIKKASSICEREIKSTVDSYSNMGGYVSMGGSAGAGRAYLSGEMHASKVKFKSEKSKACAELEKEYVKALLQKKPKPTGEIMGISGAGIKLKFNKDPGSGSLDTRADKIVRDTFTEQLGDQWEKFKYDLNYDRQAAFGSALGMIGGIAGSARLGALSGGNILAASAGFTSGLRIGNAFGQELWNSGEFLYEQISGNTISDGNNKVESFGMGFKRGLGLLNQNYEDVGTLKFITGLGFDYLSTVATFGLSQKFGGFLGKLEGVKFAGGALKFGMEELILENFFVDIPMNIVQTGFETFTGIDDGVTIGNTAIGNQHTIEGQGGYKSKSLSDMLRAMKDATTQNLSFENLSQTFFNTVIYGGFLEGGGAAIKKMKGYLPAGQVSNFTERSAAAATAFAGLTNFINSKNINFNKDGVCIDTKTNLKIEESDPRFQELCTHLNAVEATKAGVIESFETIMETQKQMVADPENRTGLLFRLGLISPTNTPLNILKKKKELAEKKLNEAKAKGNNNKANKLQKLLDIYTDAEIKLNNSDYFDGKSKKLFEGDETQARGNSEMMDNLLNQINEQNKSQKLEELRKQVSEQYEQATGEKLNLMDEQLLSILDAHEQDGKLGELTLGQLRQKVKILDETITDSKVRRFLLEAGFCGRSQEVHQNINIGNQNCEITYRGDYGEMKITNPDGTITNIDFQKNGGESKYLEIFIENGGKIENYTTIEQLCKISEEMGAGGKIGFAKELIWNLDNVIDKQILEKLINSENFSENAIEYDKYNKRHTFTVFEKILSFNVKLPQKLFNKNFLTQLINSNTFFEARAKVNYQGNELNKIYFHEMIGKYIDGIDLNSCNSELLSDLIIDYHFDKISYNVFLDIKELLRFQIEKGNFLSNEKLKIYKDILNIDKLSNEEKIELHKSLIGKNVSEMFENDIQKARETSKIEIADSILNHETIKQYKDEELSKKYGINVYNFNGQPFYALAKVGRVDRINPEYAVTRSFSLVGTECIGVWGEPGNDTFLYEGLTHQQIIHISNDDSGSGSGMHDEYGQKTDYVFRLGSPSELLSNTRGYNELIILEKGTQDTVENHQLNEIKPIAIYCYEITEDIIKTAKEYGVGIALINTQKYGGKNTPNKGHDGIFQEYMYPGNFNKSEDYYYAKENRRSELCTFDNMEEIDNMIEGKSKETDYFNGKSKKLFEGDGTQARGNSKMMDNIHFEKILDKSRTFELPLKDHVCEYIRIVKEGEYPDRQKYSYKNGKLTEDPNGCYIKLNESDITPEEGRDCFLGGLKVSSELMKGQENWAILSSGSLFLNIESYGKLGGDIDIATDITAFNNVALNRGTDGLTTLERFQRDGKIRDLIFTTIGDHSALDIKNMSEHEITELIERGDIRVEFNIPDAKGNTINCEFFPEPEGYGLIQLGTPRAADGLLSYEVDGNLIKTVSPDLAAMSYMINLANEFENNSLDAREKANEKGKKPKLKDSVRLNNFFQYLESANIRTVSDMINYIDKTIANYKQQRGKKVEIEVTEGGKKVKKTIDMSVYLSQGIEKLPAVKKLLQDVDIDYKKTLGNSRLKALRGNETKFSFNHFMNETLKIKDELFELKESEQTSQKRDEIMRKIYNLQKMVNINDPKSFSYYYEIYQLKTKFLDEVFGKNN